ncbi:MAG: NYN domain-containing protein [Candidatus Krumholzibacteriia bacterium]
MGIAAVYIDGGHLDRVVRHEFYGPEEENDYARIDYAKLVDFMIRPHELLRAYYYHCLPYRSRVPTDEELDYHDKQHRRFTRINYLPRFEWRQGYLAYRGRNAAGKPIFEQKKIDCMLAVDMTLLALKGRITHAYLLASDRDYVPVVEAVKNEGIIVCLWHGPEEHERTRPSPELKQACDDRRMLTRDVLDQVRLDPATDDL